MAPNALQSRAMLHISLFGRCFVTSFINSNGSVGISRLHQLVKMQKKAYVAHPPRWFHVDHGLPMCEVSDYFKTIDLTSKAGWSPHGL